MQLSDDQIENIRGIFHHFDWDFDSSVISDSSFLVDVETQTDSQDHTEEINDNDEEVINILEFNRILIVQSAYIVSVDHVSPMK